jgi:methylated-DNA-[protein]-cysteine S-methyltransferase
MNLFIETFATPFGPFSVAATSTGALAATAFGDLPALQARLPASPQCHIMYDTSMTAAPRAQLLEFFSGKRTRFDLSLAPAGTAFQQRVWEALQAIPFGQTRSYGSLAAELGRPSAARAVGRANATNPICVVVPCHRVVGASGALTGFAFGEDIKRRLLALEQTTLRQAA